MSSPDTTRVGVALAVSDVAAMADFYTTRLGFDTEASFDDPPYAILTRAGVRLSLAEAGHPADDLPDRVMTAPTQSSRPDHMLILEVADCDAARAELEEAGVPFLSDTFRPPWGGARCFLTDPEGTVIELEQLA